MQLAAILTGKINANFEEAGLRVIAQKRIHMTKEQAGKFYEVHSERPFYDELCDFMSSAPVIVQVLEGESAISKNREVMGATNPADAAPGTMGQILQKVWAKTQYMVLMLLKPLLSRSLISFLE